MKMYIGCIYIFSLIYNIPRVFEHRWESSQDGTSTQIMKTDLGCSYSTKIRTVGEFMLLETVQLPCINYKYQSSL